MREDLPYPVYAPWFDLADRVFERLPMLDLYHVQDQRSGEKICLYMAVKDHSDIQVINYTVWARKDPSVMKVSFEFRHIKFLPEDIKGKLLRHHVRILKAELVPENFDEVMGYADKYLEKVLEAAESGRWEVGAKR